MMWFKNYDVAHWGKWSELNFYSESFKDLLEMAQSAVGQNQWEQASRLYTCVIERFSKTQDVVLSYINRSSVNVQLNRFEKALHDSSAVRHTVEGAYEEASAFYTLGKFEESLEKWVEFRRVSPESRDSKDQISRTTSRLREKRTGIYNFASMHDQARSCPPIIDAATYCQRVEVRETNGRGKGLFVTKEVQPGDLILCEKAFAYSINGRLRKETYCEPKWSGEDELVTKVIQKLYYSPQFSKEFKALYHGDYQPLAVEEIDGWPVVDSSFVKRVIALNRIICPRSSHGKYSFGDKEIFRKKSMDGVGIWLLASRINHSCMGNCHRSFIGDMQIVRARQPLKSGTELQFEYGFPQDSDGMTMPQFVKYSAAWGFICRCRWCRIRCSTDDAQFEYRRRCFDELEKFREAIAQCLPGDPQCGRYVTGVKQLFDNMRECYHMGSEAKVYLDLGGLYHALGRELVSRDEHGEAARHLLHDGIISQGFGMYKMRFTRWGYRFRDSAEILRSLILTYQKFAPSMCCKVATYAMLAYLIETGSYAGVYDVFPELERYCPHYAFRECPYNEARHLRICHEENEDGKHTGSGGEDRGDSLNYSEPRDDITYQQ